MTNMWELLRFIMSLFPAARRATRELEKLELVREVEEAFHAKMIMWGGTAAVVGATLTLSALFWERTRSARQADESGARESRLKSELVLAKQENELGQARCEVRGILVDSSMDKQRVSHTWCRAKQQLLAFLLYTLLWYWCASKAKIDRFLSILRLPFLCPLLHKQ